MRFNMIEIRRVEDPCLQERLCKEAGIELRPEYHIIATREGEKILLSAIFQYKDEAGAILSIEGPDNDIMLLDGLCRAILNIMDINGVKEVSLPLKYGLLARNIGFTKGETAFSLQLEGFFDQPCCGKKGE